MVLDENDQFAIMVVSVPSPTEPVDEWSVELPPARAVISLWSDAKVLEETPPPAGEESPRASRLAQLETQSPPRQSVSVRVVEAFVYATLVMVEVAVPLRMESTLVESSAIRFS